MKDSISEYLARLGVCAAASLVPLLFGTFYGKVLPLTITEEKEDSSPRFLAQDKFGNTVTLESGRIFVRFKDGTRMILPDDVEKLNARVRDFEEMFDECFVIGGAGI